MVVCACGCGTEMKDRDLYARPRRYISGHNTRKYTGTDATRKACSRRYSITHKAQLYERRKAYWRRRKVQLLRMHGESCIGCGIRYNGSNACVFHFHHRDPGDKIFSLGNQVANRDWETILIEAAKCDLLCANCHEMRHSGAF